MALLMWVSEWRIKEHDNPNLPLKVSNGGVYTPARSLQDANRILKDNINSEKRAFHEKNLTCPNCKKLFADHMGGMCELINCLKQLAIDGVK